MTQASSYHEDEQLRDLAAGISQVFEDLDPGFMDDVMFRKWRRLSLISGGVSV